MQKEKIVKFSSLNGTALLFSVHDDTVPRFGENKIVVRLVESFVQVLYLKIGGFEFWQLFVESNCAKSIQQVHKSSDGFSILCNL